MNDAQGAWLDDELAGCTLDDARLTKRLRILLSRMVTSPGVV